MKTELLIIKSILELITDKVIRNVLLLSLVGILRKVSYLTSNFANDYVPRNKKNSSDVLNEFVSEYEKLITRINQ